MTCASDVFGWTLTAVLDRERVSIYLHLTVMEDGGMFLRKGVWRSDRDERLTSLRTSWSEWLLTAAMCFKCVNTSGPVMMDKSIPLKTDRQADRQTDRQTGKQTDRQAEMLTSLKMCWSGTRTTTRTRLSSFWATTPPASDCSTSGERDREEETGVRRLKPFYWTITWIKDS